MQIYTLAFKPSLSRAKILVGAIAAALALAVSVQGAAPTSASAQPNADQCMRWWNKIVYAIDNEIENDQIFYEGLFNEYNCDGAISGI